MMHPGLRAVCIREVQKDLKDSAKLIIEDKLNEYGLGERDGFKIRKDEIETPGGGLIIFKGMRDYTANSIKSLEGFDRAWVEEAQTLSALSMQMLRPTIRKAGSELWFSWNPRRKTDPVDEFFRGREAPSNATIVEANWSDNPWFPAELEDERQHDLKTNPDQYEHIWEGGYVSVAEGAYFARNLSEARKEGRIGHVAADPLMTYRAFWDIGGTGAKADATSIWVAQFINREIRVLDYYEAVGQPLSAHVNWLRERGYGNAYCILPHDGAHSEKVHDVSYEGALREAGFDVEVIPNQGRGAAKLRIEAARRLFKSIWINQDTCGPGLDALGWYHEKRDEERNVGLGPEHDWSSHAADAFGLMCVAYEAPQNASLPKPNRRWVL